MSVSRFSIIGAIMLADADAAAEAAEAAAAAAEAAAAGAATGGLASATGASPKVMQPARKGPIKAAAKNEYFMAMS